MRPIKLVRITTVPLSMRLLLGGQPAYMRSKGMDVTLVSAEGADWEGIPDIGAYDVHKIGMSRQIDPIKDLRALWLLTRLFRRIKPDIVHSHTPKAGLLGMLAAKAAGVPVRMHTVAGMPLMESRGIKRWVLSQAERMTYACASMVYPNSYHLKDFIAAAGLTRPAKLKVLAGGSSNGIDTDYFLRTAALEQSAAGLRRSLGIPPDAMVFVFVGRLVKDKGINELVKAFEAVHAKTPHTRLLLVGPFEEELDPVAAHTKNSIDRHEAIISVGFQKDVRPYLTASDILAFPSYREGFPNVPMQAGCLGLPSIVTDINGCNEIIQEGVNGLIVPPKDGEALAGAMERLVLDEALRTRCAVGARARILEKYRQQVVWEALYEEYQRSLKDLN